MMNRMLAGLLGGLLLVWSVLAVAGDLAPYALARNTTSDVINIVKQDKDIKSGNKQKIYALVDEKVLPHFDFQKMAQLAVGKNWRTASPDQQARLVTEFRSLMVRTYATALSSVVDYKIEFKPVHMQPGDEDVMVGTEVSKPGMPPVTIDYAMRKLNGHWKVYDVKVDGASLIVANRSSFARLVREGGIDGLIADLVRQNKGG